MATGIVHFFDGSRFLGSSGGASGATVFFYYSNTSTLAPIWSDINLTTPMLNPVSISVGAVVPNIYLSPTITYRRRIVFTDGTVQDVDPLPSAFNINSLYVSSASELAAVNGSVYNQAYLNGDLFTFLSGNQTSKVSSDPYKGLYIPPATDTTGASGCWARVWDGLVGYPEWFGARTGDGTFDNAPILEAAHALCPILQLGGKDYFTKRTTVFNVNYREVRGNGRYWSDGQPVTRIILTGSLAGTSDVIRVGQLSVPGHVNDFTHDMTIKDIQAVRDGTLVNPTNKFASPSGWRFQGVNRCYFERLGSYANQAVSYYIKGAVRCFWNRCGGDRSLAGSGGNPDIYYGFLVDATASFIGSAGGNASIFFDECIIGGGGGSWNPIAMHLVGACNDTFVDRFEALGCATGIDIEGTQTGDPLVRNTNGNLDIHIRGVILDGCSVRGIFLHGLSPTAQVDVIDSYTALSGSTGTACIHVQAGGGQVTFTGGQAVGTSDGGNGVGLLIDSCGGVHAEGLKLVNCKRPVICINGSSDFHLNVSVNNIESAVTSGEQAVTVIGCSRGTIAATVKGGSNKFPAGVRVNSASDKISVDMTKVQPECITGGAANKLLINGVSITTPGYYTSAGASGSSGSGIHVTGITT